MKKLIIALIAIAGLFNAATAKAEDAGYLKTIYQKSSGSPVTQNILVVPAGQAFEAVSVYSNSAVSGLGGWDFTFTFIFGSDEYPLPSRQAPVGTWAGPITVKLSTSSQSMVAVTYRIFPNLSE